MDEIAIAKQIRTAIKAGDLATVAAFIGTSKDRLNMMTPFGTWLHVAAAHGQLAIVQRLLFLGADVNRRGGILGGTALNEAASKGHLAIVECLLSHGAEMDVSEPERNPLFGAIYGGYREIVQLLLDHGINASIKYSGQSMNNMDAVAFARERGQTEIAELLTQRD